MECPQDPVRPSGVSQHSLSVVCCLPQRLLLCQNCHFHSPVLPSGEAENHRDGSQDSCGVRVGFFGFVSPFHLGGLQHPAVQLNREPSEEHHRGEPGGRHLLSESLYIYLTWAVLPFLLFVASSTLLIASLWRHTRQMRQRTMGLKDPRTEAHIAALKSLISFLILYICTFVADVLHGAPSCRLGTEWKRNICLLVVAVCPSIHGVLLIFFNFRLKSILLYVACHRKKDNR